MNGPGDRVRALAGAQLAFQMAFDVVAVFVVNNLCIAVVINNLESTRNEEQRRSDDWLAGVVDEGSALAVVMFYRLAAMGADLLLFGAGWLASGGVVSRRGKE